MAVIKLHGAIYRHSQTAFRRAIESALSDTSVSSIMVHMDSPGGLVSGTKELADFIYSSRKVKPMAVYVDGLCASAAMWISSAFGTIYAPATANLGSVGVISILPNIAPLLAAQANMQTEATNNTPNVEANILANLQSLSSKPIDTTNGIQEPQTKSALIADAERRNV